MNDTSRENKTQNCLFMQRGCMQYITHKEKNGKPKKK